ncbi:MAG: PTS sugar transporter subunit IIA [Deltaproteobacteria bacterium]|nr:PTS sugar transporter subunit IIA [Deltaproteobacteria bacterium]
MKITDFLTPDRVIADLSGKEKTAVLDEMARQLASSDLILEPAACLRVLQEREKISTTAIGEGVAIPHGKLPNVQRVSGLFARSLKGVDFASLDGEPTYLFFLLIAPQDAAADHLKALARISRLLKDPALRDRLMAAKTRQEIYDIIATEDQKF